MTKFGKVTGYDEAKGIATVTFTRPEACEKCGACGGRVHTGTIALEADCRIGQWVRVEMPEGRFVHATLLAYVLPLMGLLAGLFLGNALGGGSDGATLLGGVVGLALPLLYLWWNEKRLRNDSGWKPSITAVYDKQPSEDEIGCG